jgi:hypothetical protein
MSEFAVLYLYLSLAVGLAQVADCVVHVANLGRPGFAAMAFSFIEWVWGAVSVYALVEQPEGLLLWLPAAFTAYLLAWLVYGVAMVKQGRDTSNFKLSPREAMAGGVFGALLAGSAGLCLLLQGA